MPRQHAWTTREEDGCKREVRAVRFAGKFRLQSKRADEENWTYHDRPSAEDLATLKDVIDKKYRRRRATADEVKMVTELFREHGYPNVVNND